MDTLSARQLAEGMDARHLDRDLSRNTAPVGTRPRPRTAAARRDSLARSATARGLEQALEEVRIALEAVDRASVNGAGAGLSRDFAECYYRLGRLLKAVGRKYAEHGDG